MKRLRILQEDFKTDILQKICETHQEESVRERIARFISVALNPARDICAAVAMSYDLGVRRILKGAPEEAQLAFSQLVKESGAATKAPMWNRFAFMLGPTLVVPAVRKGRLQLELLRPDVTDIRPDPDDPMGTPAAAAWAASGSDTAFVLLDEQRWRYLDDKGKEVRASQAHDLGYFPGSVFRLDEPVDDFWPRHYQERLVDATIQVAYVYTKMSWVRKAQNKKILSVIGDTESIPAGQQLDPELSFVAKTDNANALQVAVLDFETSPTAFLEEIRFTVEQVIESYGIPQSAVTYDTSSEGGFMAASIKRERLGHLREAQIPFLNRGEQDLWPKVVAVCRQAGHPIGAKLPPPDEVREMLSVEWPKLKVIDDPLAREQLYREQVKRGGASPLDPLQEDNPHLTRDECRVKMQENVADLAWLLDAITSRGLVMDLASGLVASSQALGKMGPMVRDGTAPAPAPTDPPENDPSEPGSSD